MFGSIVSPGFATLPSVMLAVRDGTLRMELARRLRNDGFTVSETSSTLHLVGLLGEAILDNPEAPRPDCLVLDIDHPGVTGLSLLGELRALGWDTPAVLLMNEDLAALADSADVCNTWQPAWVLHRPIEIVTVQNMVWAFCVDRAHQSITTGTRQRV